jgi:hypothetical protein
VIGFIGFEHLKSLMGVQMQLPEEQIEKQRQSHQESAFEEEMESLKSELVQTRQMDAAVVEQAIEALRQTLIGVSVGEILRLENHAQRELLRSYTPSRSSIVGDLSDTLQTAYKHRLYYQSRELKAESASIRLENRVRELELRAEVTLEFRGMIPEFERPPSDYELDARLPEDLTRTALLAPDLEVTITDPITAILDQAFPLRNREE